MGKSLSLPLADFLRVHCDRGCRFRSAEVLRELAYSGKLEQIGDRNLCLQRFLQIGMHGDQQQRIAAEIKEILVQPYLWDFQDALPELCEGALQLAFGNALFRRLRL